MTARHTHVVSTPLAGREARLAGARAHAHGRQVMSMADVAARLAGGFLQPPSREALQQAVRDALAGDDLGTLTPAADLPGMVRAAVATLNKAWLADVTLAGAHARLRDLGKLETAVTAALPASMRRPPDLAAAARARVATAPATLGPVTFIRVPDVDPVWRPLVRALADHVPVVWEAGRRPVPEWLDDTTIEVRRDTPTAPQVSTELCANPRHEALEALRWARALMARGEARPDQIAIAAADPGDWDAHFQAMAADANIDLHFVHGRPVVSFADGQACAALAEVLVNGLSQDRVRRLVQLVRAHAAELAELPDDWTRDLPPDAPLLSYERWRQALDARDAFRCGRDFRGVLYPVLEMIERGPEAAEEAGERLLSGRALAIWRKALNEGPAQALDVTLQQLKTDDGLEPGACVAWMRADDLAAAPRPYVRLIGLTSRAWPRRQSEDPLLPNHVVPTEQLDPMPVPRRDRRDFQAILESVAREVVVTRARRNPEGRLLGASPLWPRDAPQTYLRRARVPAHAASEADRLLARRTEFAAHAVAVQATTCWHHWHRNELTRHDGLVRADHPLLLEALARTQSATSLRKLLRDPIGYVWAYALRWEAPAEDEEPLALDNRDFGDLVHETLEAAVHELETSCGLAAADPDRVAKAVARAAETRARDWEQQRPVPPDIIWHRTLESARQMAGTALQMDAHDLDGQRSWPEVPFGRRDWPVEASDQLPWDPATPVHIPGTDVAITGSIDRLDLSLDRRAARVTDYKTGKVPRDIEQRQLNGGSELQRCLYGFAVRALLGDELAVDARLAYPAEGGGLFPMDDAPTRLDELAGYVRLAHDSLRQGLAVIGPDSEADWNEYAFALPGNAKARYLRDKAPLARAALGDLPQLWETD